MKRPTRTPGLRIVARLSAATLVFALAGTSGAQTTPPGAAAPGAAPEPEPDAGPVMMETYEVTGSHIRRIDAETVSPVVELGSVDIGRFGYPTIGDALRALPFNSGQALSPTDSGNSFTPGVSTINLRGLGNNQTLVLMNGRRAVPYATPGFNGLQTVFDFNSLPQSAINSIEILKDGGSAIYGSDAVAGVVNVRMRRDYQGLAVEGEIGNYYDTDGLLRKGSISVGNISGKLSTFLSLNWAQQNGVDARDVKWAADADKTSVAHKANGRYTATGWEAAGFASEREYLESLDALDAIADGNFNNSSSRGFPGYVTVRQDLDNDGVLDVDEDGVPIFYRRTFAQPTDTPTDAGDTAGPNLFNFQSQAGLFPEYRNFSIYTRAQYDFSPDLYGFTEFSFNRFESTPAAAATPVDIEAEHGLDPGDPMVLPAYNPFNPYGVDIVNGRRRLVELSQRINDVVSDTPRILVGLGGNLPVLDDWTWEVGVLYNRNTITNLNRGSASDARMQQSLMGLTRNADGSLGWNPATPRGERVYFNWFGNNEKAFADFLEIQNPTSDSLQYWTYDGRASGRVFTLPAGDVSVAVGFEHTAQKWSHIQTDLNATGGILGGSESTSSRGQRSQLSIYAEANVPVFENLEVQLAARYEDYSDRGFADEARPKIGFKYRPLSWLLLRGSYSESFKAPDLAYLFTASSTSFTSFQVQDPVTGTEIDAVQIVTAGNPDLEPEVADTWYAGIVFEAPQRGFLSGFEASVEYFDLDQQDALAQLSDFYGYAEFFQENASGNPLFAGKVIRDPATNEVLYIRDDYTNISSTRYKALDFGLRYRYQSDALGAFQFQTDVTKIVSYVLDEDQIAGDHLTPKWNATANLSWTRGDWGISVTEIVKGYSRRNLSFGNIYTDEDELFLTYDMRNQWLTNVALSYRGFTRTTVTVGATNVFNQTPPVDPFEPAGTTPGVNYAEPGFWYVRVAREF